MRVIRTPRLVLEPQVHAHAEAMFDVLCDPAIYTHENAPPPSLEWLRERYRKLESRRSGDGREQWLNWVIRTGDGRLAGYVQATVQADGTASIAYEFGSAWWGQGLAGEAVAAMIDELHAHYRVRRLAAVFKTANTRSQRLLERQGFAPAPSAAVKAAAIDADESLMLRTIAP
jgi:RimJ/RimL family protein N-acetyltransferase